MGQFDIDTTEVLFRRYKYNINLETNDSTLRSVLTKYEGGLYHRKDFLTKGEEELVYVFKLKNPKDSVDLDVLRLNLYSQIAYRKAWFKFNSDNLVIRDSTVFNKYDETKVFDFYSKQIFNQNGELKFVTTIDGKTREITRDEDGSIKRITTFKNDKITDVEMYIDDIIFRKQKYFNSKASFDILYKYDSEKRLISKSENRLRTVYEYFDSKVIKKTIWIPRNIEKDRTVYKYDSQGHLTEETLYYGDRIASKSIYITALN